MALLIFSLLVTVIFSLSGESSLVSFYKERMQLWPGHEPFLTGRPYSLIWCLLLGNNIVKQSKIRGGSRIFFRRGCTRLLLYFNTNKPVSYTHLTLPTNREV